MTINYYATYDEVAEINDTLDMVTLLAFHAFINGRGQAYAYTITGDISDNSETSYDTYINWTEVDSITWPKPTFNDIMTNNSTAKERIAVNVTQNYALATARTTSELNAISEDDLVTRDATGFAGTTVEAAGKEIMACTGMSQVVAKILADSAGEAAMITKIQTETAGKVDKVTGKGLSTEDYTSAEKTKLAGLSAPVARSFANPTRSLNTSFQPSTTRDAIVSYSVDVTTALSLTGGQAGTVYLRYADDTGFTTNVTEVCRFSSSNTGALTIGLALNQISTGTLSGVIPANKFVRLVTANDTGTPTFTYRRAQEVLI